MSESRPREAQAAPTETGRKELAMAFLQEAVYRSREAQAGATGLAAPKAGGGQCGLGEKASIVLDLSERGAALFEELWPTGLDEARLGEVRAIMAAWIERQDTLDRKRNHFMKDFRQRHGFDRTQYDAAQRADWDAGLDAVNGEVDARLRESAADLLDAAE